MKKHLYLLPLAAIVLGFSACNESGDANDTATKKDSTVVATAENTPPMDSAAKMKAWMDYMTPGKAHQMLAASAGKWKTENTMWMEPGAPAQTATGEADNSMMFEGRYLRTTHKSVMDGMPFQGEGTMAYDNKKGLYISTWIDNMGTGIMTLEGPYDEASKTLTLKGTCVDPTTGKSIAIREVTKMVDANNQVMEMYSTTDGKEFKNMEMKMTKL